MQFRDLLKQYDTLRPQIDKAMSDVAAAGHYIMGPQVQELEERLASYVGVNHCLTCASGTDALTLALKAWGVGPGDAVFVPDFTFFASAEVASLEGATPVFVDVDASTFNIDPASLECAVQAVLAQGILTPRVVVAVDLFGLPADFAAIRSVANRYGLLLLEDGAQGFGGSINGRKACSFGDIATTSFFPAKPLGCYGDGGAVFTDNDQWASIISSCRLHGKGSDKYDNVRIGLNSRLDTLQAAILLVKLSVFDEELHKVNELASLYSSLLSDVVCTPTVPDGFISSWAQYTVRLPGDLVARTSSNQAIKHSNIQTIKQSSNQAIKQALKAQGVPSMIYYPKPMHAQTAFHDLPQPLDYSTYRANNLCNTVLSLPMHPYLSPSDIELISTTILSITNNL